MEPGASDFGFALWLALDAASTQALSLVIGELARDFAGPVFTPHVTLRARLSEEHEALQLAMRVSSNASRFRVRLTRLDAGSVPFQALTLRPDDASAFEPLARRAGVDLSSYAPHLSLYYGDADPQALIATAQARLTLPVDVEITAVEVWRLQGDVPTWRRCAALALR